MSQRPRLAALAAAAASLLAMSTAPSPARAQTPSANASATPLSPIVITSTRSPQRADESIAEVTVIDRAQIDAATGRTLVDLLGRQPGVRFTNSGGYGRASSIFMRGLESRHTLLLIDGIRYGSATVGTPAWENLPLDAIERIEIVRGPLSALYGSDAAAGVVQIFTRKGTGANGVVPDASASVGSAGFGQIAGGVRVGGGEVDGALRAAYVRNTGFSATHPGVPFGNFNPDNDGFKQGSASAQLGGRLAPGWRGDVNLSQSEARVQVDDGPGVDARVGLRTQVAAAQLLGKVSPLWTTTARIGRTVDEYDTLATASAFTPLGVVRSEQQQVAAENSIATPLGTALLLGEYLTQKVARPGAAFAVSERNITAVAAGLDGRSGVHGWQASLRHDRNSQFGNQTTGALGYRRDLTPQWQGSASYGTSFVAPSFNQLYFPNFGNPNLLPEEGRHGELAVRWAEAATQLRLAYVDNRIRGFISSGPAPTNIPRIRIDGWVASLQSEIAGWSVGASAERLDPRNDTAGSANFDKLLPRRVRNALRASADTSVGAWRVGGQWIAMGPSFDDAANKARLGGFGTVDLRADWRLDRAWAVGVALNNLGDKRYETVLGYNQPGRQGFLTLRYGAE